MKIFHKTALLFASLLLFSAVEAQNVRIPNASFEKWTSSGFFITTKTPDNWYGLSIKAGSMKYDLVKPAQTTDAQDSSYAVSVSTTQLNSTLAAVLKALISAMDTTGNLDSSLDFTRPFTGMLSNASIDIVSVLSSLSSFSGLIGGDSSSLSNMDSLLNLMSLLSQLDLGKFLQGGLAVAPKVPHRLSGYYKYTVGKPNVDSTGVDSLDNGLALMIGIGRDTASQRSVFTGGGLYMLQPTSVYKKFNVDYLQLGQLYPDTVVFLFLSSMSGGLAGSQLILDNFSLSTYTIDTMQGLALDSVDSHHAYLHWTKTSNALAWQVACGDPGSSPDSMYSTTSMKKVYTRSSLLSNTDYALYVRPIIALNLYGPWSKALLFHTPKEPCYPVENLKATELTDSSAVLQWRADTKDSITRYVLQVFFQTDTLFHDTLCATGSQPLGHLLEDTLYTVRMQLICRDTLSEWTEMSFRTLKHQEPGVKVRAADLSQARIYPNPSDGKFCVELPEGEHCRMSVCNILGQCVLQQELTGVRNECVLDVPGIYFIRLSAEKGNHTLRMIVQ